MSRAPGRADAAVCAICKRTLTAKGPRVIVGGTWRCGDCQYALDHEGAVMVERAKRPRRPQAMTLFQLDDLSRRPKRPHAAA